MNAKGKLTAGAVAGMSRRVAAVRAELAETERLAKTEAWARGAVKALRRDLLEIESILFLAVTQ